MSRLASFVVLTLMVCACSAPPSTSTQRFPTGEIIDLSSVDANALNGNPLAGGPNDTFVFVAEVGAGVLVGEVSTAIVGGNVVIYFNDGQVLWLTRPVLPNGDNIWLPTSKTAGPGPIHLDGDETPSHAEDAFVGP